MYCGQGSVALLWGARGCCRRPAARALRHVCPAENIPGGRTYTPLAGLSRCCCCTRAPIVACPGFCRPANAASGLCSPPLSRADELCTIANMLALQPGAFEFSRGCTCTGKSLRTGSRTRRRPPRVVFVCRHAVSRVSLTRLGLGPAADQLERPQHVRAAAHDGADAVRF